MSEGVAPLIDVSVIIPTLNRATSLGRALDSAEVLDYPADRYEVIVVDNGSTDGTAAVAAGAKARSTGRTLRYVREEALGLHNARHTGARTAAGSILVFTDDDATFDRKWICAYADAFEAHPRMVAAGGPVRPSWEVPPPDWLLHFLA